MCENFTKEQSFLLSVLRFSLVEKSFDNQSYDLTHTEYNSVVDLASEHNVVPLIALAFNDRCFEFMPEDVVNRVNDINRELVARNLYILNELCELNEEFNLNKLEYILLKGPALGAELYDSIDLRHIGDLDLLVRKENIEKAVNLLFSRGYHYFFDLTDEQKKIYEKSAIYLTDHDMHYSFYHPKKEIFVELHWALMPEKYSFSQNTYDIFNRKKIVRIKDNEISAMSDEDLIIYLSLHGAKHGWSRLFWVCDIVCFLIKKKNTDWPAVITRAEALNCTRSLHIALLVSEFIAPGILNKNLHIVISRNKATESIMKKIRENLFNSDDDKEIKNNKNIFVGSMENYSDKIRLYLDMILKPTIYEVEIVNLPKNLYFAYYFIRPLRLLYKYTKRLF